jgi:tripartite-type tricarboxylate transporter receptor subunit TctC
MHHSSAEWLKITFTTSRSILAFNGVGILGVASMRMSPERPVTMVVSFAPGGAADSTGSIVADAISRTFVSRLCAGRVVPQ